MTDPEKSSERRTAEAEYHAAVADFHARMDAGDHAMKAGPGFDACATLVEAKPIIEAVLNTGAAVGEWVPELAAVVAVFKRLDPILGTICPAYADAPG